MKIVVIGRSGQVASALAERGGNGVSTVGRPEIDLAEPATVSAALSSRAPDVVINAAAYTAVDAAESDPDAAMALNAVGPGALADHCAREGIPLIHLSTDYVFDGTLNRPYREDDPIGPRSVYGRTKAEGEARVRAAGGRALVVRTAWVYSPFGKNFVRTMLRLGGERDTLRVVADQHGNPTSALDIADALIALAGRSAEWPDAPQTLHLAGTGSTTWHGFAEAIMAFANLAVTVEPVATSEYPTAAVRPANSQLDCRRLRDAYGISLPEWRESAAAVVERLVADA